MNNIKIIILLILITILIIIIFEIYDNVINYDYLYIDEYGMNTLNISDRWKIRIKCLKVYNSIKHDYCYKNFIYPLPNYNKNDLIFVNIASYRDSECNNTIKSLIINSDNWKNLRIVVCEQNSKDDKSCLYNLDTKYLSIINLIQLSYKDARGPTYARYLIQQQYNSEEYYLQIDSHTIFEKSWDTKLKKTLNELPNKSCLTQYLPDYEIGKTKTDIKLRSNLKVHKICSLDGFTRIRSDKIDTSNIDTYKNTKPYTCNAWSACFSFSKGDICKDAPIDCYTPDVFFAEEMDITLRLYTRGWNFYAPNYPIAYTNFNRNYRKTFWNKKEYNKNITMCSRLRIHYRLGTLPNYIKKIIENQYPMLLCDVDKFKLGNLRTLSDYEKLIGFNFVNEK